MTEPGLPYKWAMLLVSNGALVRRPHWPKEMIKAGTVYEADGVPYTIDKTFTRTWHLFYRYDQVINGWGGQVGCGDRPVFEGHADGMLYSPTPEDEAASDWELFVPER